MRHILATEQHVSYNNLFIYLIQLINKDLFFAFLMHKYSKTTGSHFDS